MTFASNGREHVYLGSSPTDEPCAQKNDPGYGPKAYAETGRYIAQLRRLYAVSHGGRECPAVIRRKSEAHDFGRYYEVVASYDPDVAAEETAALWLKNNAPSHWEAEQ